MNINTNSGLQGSGFRAPRFFVYFVNSFFTATFVHKDGSIHLADNHSHPTGLTKLPTAAESLSLPLPM